MREFDVKNKILTSVFVFCLALPVSSVFAADNNMLSGKTLHTHSGPISTNGSYSGVSSKNATDGNLDTYMILESYNNPPGAADHLLGELNSLSKVNAVRVKSDATEDNFLVFYTGDETQLKEGGLALFPLPVSANDYSIYYLDKEAIGISMNLYNTNPSKSYKIYEFEAYYLTESVQNLTSSKTFDSVNLSWTAPKSKGVTNYIVKQDGIKIADLDTSKTSYSITGLEENKSYTFEVVADYGVNGLSESATATVTTDNKPNVEVTGLKVLKNSQEQIEISWTNPAEFEKVTIYRKEKSGSEFEKVSEITTGNTYKDTTIKSNTTYTYKVTTTVKGVESKGVTIDVKSNSVSIGGVVTEESEGGDYKITWETPTTGQIKIVVGGEVYKTVPASEQQVIIPAASMKYDKTGGADVSLIPLSEDGTEIGGAIKPGDIGGIISNGLGGSVLSAANLLKTGLSLLGLVGGFVLLGLAFRVVPKLISIIVDAVNNKGYSKEGRRGARL